MVRLEYGDDGWVRIELAVISQYVIRVSQSDLNQVVKSVVIVQNSITPMTRLLAGRSSPAN